MRAASVFALLCVPAWATAEAPVNFDRVVAPWLIEHCIDCHSGPNPKGKLDLTTQVGVRKGGRGGPSLFAGKPEDSLLWQRVRDGEMPPKKPIAEKDREILKQWIASGAKWGADPIDPFRTTTSKRAGADWWSLKSVRNPNPPKIADSAWPLQPLDRFILAALDAKGLKPSPEADRRTLLRRLSFDLIGLPPNVEEVDAFVNDRSADAYERLVDRLLASKHYGERWARHWLDVVRFGESDGFERNAARPNAWHYRDWVIRALNDDLPYDEFCRLQLAGDVLRPTDPDAVKAAGFLVAGIHNTVLPMNAVAKETAFQDELEDLVGTIGQTFLGLTANCGRCHEHKFDPISQKDYYRIASAVSGVRHGERTVSMAQYAEGVEKRRRRVDELAAELISLEAPIRKAILAERREKGAEDSAAPSPLAAWDFREGPKDRLGELHVQLVGGAKLTSDGLLLDGKTGFARSAPLTKSLSAKTLEVWVKLGTLEQSGGGAMTVETPDGTAFDSIVFAEKEPRRWVPGSDFFRRTRDLKGPAEEDAAKATVHLAFVYGSDGTITAYRNGVRYGEQYKSSGPAAFEAGKAVVAFGIRHEPAGGNRMLAGAVVQARLYDRALQADEVAASSKSSGFVSERDLVARLSPELQGKRDKLQKELAEERQRLAELTATRNVKVYTNVPQQPPVTRLLIRGQASDPSDVVAAGGLSFVSTGSDLGLSPDAPEGERRKKLAAWITDRDTPLFARVMVNRLWHHHFGVGIVETPSDFGFNGGRPSHAELLDHLASEFIRGGYQLKTLHRLIVTSATYRQASLPRKECLAVDADNRLLWRMRPKRLDGEMLRDSMLAVSGLLNREYGGKGFTDYKQQGGAGTEYYDPIDPVSPEHHRRSIYRFLPRSANQGLLDVFDCPDPAASAPRRNMTTTPLQALALWNGGFALRMSEATADRVAKAESELAAQVQLAYRIALQRDPSNAERAAALRLVEQHGLRALCRGLFNSNEFLTAE